MAPSMLTMEASAPDARRTRRGGVNRLFALLVAVLLLPLRVMAAMVRDLRFGMRAGAMYARSFRADTRAVLDISGKAMGLIGTVIGILVILTIIGTTFGDLQTSVREVNENLSNSNLGDDSANSIAGVFPLLVAIGFLLGIVGIILAVVQFRKNR